LTSPPSAHSCSFTTEGPNRTTAATTRLRAALLALAALLRLSAPASAQKRGDLRSPGQTLTGWAVGVGDGDAIDLRISTEQRTAVRLFGIDAPEEGGRSSPEKA